MFQNKRISFVSWVAGFFLVLFFMAFHRPAGATVITVSVGTAKLTITVLDGAIEVVTTGGKVVSLDSNWQGGVSGAKLKAKAMNDLAELTDSLFELNHVLQTVVNGASVPIHEAHTDAVLAKAGVASLAKIIQAGATEEGIKVLSPIEQEIQQRLTEIVTLLTPAQPPVDCSTCGDPSCCSPGSACCQDTKACPNGCQ